ncbi:glycosyltransferase family 4 protein [Bacillaceae bacterium]
MNIWIFNHYAIAPGSSGGTRHFDLAKELVKHHYQVTIFASSFDHLTRTEKYIHEPRVYSREEEYEGVKFVWIKTFPYQRNDWRRVLNMLSYTIRAYRIARKRKEKPDVIIGSLMHPFAALLGYILAKQKGSKFYFEERDLWPQSLIDLGKVSPKNPVVWFLDKLELFLYKKADKIIVLFDKAADYVEKRGIDRNKVLYIPNGVDLHRYNDNEKPLPLEIAEAFNRLKEKFIAVYTGSHGLANNLDAILDAAKILKEKNKEIHFVLVGDGPEKERLVKRKQQEKLTNVTFLPPLPKECIPAILKKANVGLLPLQHSPVFKWGISPNKLFDYMASSLPVIILCDVDGTPVEKSESGAVIRNQYSEKLAEKLLEYVKDQIKLQGMGQRGRAYIEKHHSWQMLSKKIIETL